MTGEANKTLKTKNNTSIRSKHQKGLPNSATSGAGMTLRNPVRETFFVVGELNHTFALKPAHNQKHVGKHPPTRNGTGRFAGGLGFLPLSVRCIPARVRQGSPLPANGYERPTPSSRCYPRSHPKRTLHERCERYRERFTNAPAGRFRSWKRIKHRTSCSDRSSKRGDEPSTSPRV